MSGPKGTKVWPLWGRVLFWIVFWIVLVILPAWSIYSDIVRGHLKWSAIRVVLVVVLVPGLTLLLATRVQA